MNRRNFIKAASCGALLTGALPSVSHAAAENRPPIPGSLGMLYDSTLCVGCQACVTKCQDINFPERNPQGNRPGRTTTNCRRIPITSFRCGPAAQGSTKTRRRTATRTLRNSVCTASIELCLCVPGLCAEKDPKTGIVHYDKDVCTGCRYCMVACPYNVPKYDYNNPFGALHKCELCNQKVWNVSIKAVCLAA